MRCRVSCSLQWFQHLSCINGTDIYSISDKYIKDKYSISDTGYHELSMLSDLPSSKQVKKLKYTLNSHYSIKKAPADIIRVQQSLKEQLIPCITNIINDLHEENIASCFQVKLTGDGTQIGRGFTVVNFAFTILEEGEKSFISWSPQYRDFQS